MGLYDLDIGRIFDLPDTVGNGIQNSFPKHNLFKTENNEYFLEFALAGYSKEDIRVEIDNKSLIISSEKKEHDGRTYLDRGVSYRRFKRIFALDDKVDIQKIESSFKNGMLTISLPFKEDSKPVKKLLSIK